ncbi:MAG: hypothetical protein OQK82_06755 [Candidatus Pacearchaeota archaeon]|nr:hypothetical protein [Candidatus Pacearchaeota archaeon]
MIEKLKKELSEILKHKEINLIIFGETHSFLDDNLIQEEIIKSFNPTIFFYEMLEETELINSEEQVLFLAQPDNKDFSIISTFGELKNTIKLANKYDIPVVGNDIKDMCRENKDFLEKTELSDEEIKNEEDILLKREERQSNKIIKSVKKNEKVLATTGAFHLREDSPLLNLNLDAYLIIYPAYEGKQLFEPPEDFSIDKVTFEMKIIFKDG